MDDLYLWFKSTLFYKDPVFRDLVLSVIPSIIDIIVATICFVIGRMTKKVNQENREQIDEIVDKYNALLLEKDKKIRNLKNENKKLRKKIK